MGIARISIQVLNANSGGNGLFDLENNHAIGTSASYQVRRVLVPFAIQAGELNFHPATLHRAMALRVKDSHSDFCDRLWRGRRRKADHQGGSHCKEHEIVSHAALL
jgi:hypothetical protein